MFARNGECKSRFPDRPSASARIPQTRNCRRWHASHGEDDGEGLRWRNNLISICRNDFLYLQSEPVGTPCSLPGDKTGGNTRLPKRNGEKVGYSVQWGSKNVLDKNRSGRPLLVTDDLLMAALFPMGSKNAHRRAQNRETRKCFEFSHTVQCDGDNLALALSDYYFSLHMKHELGAQRFEPVNEVKIAIESGLHWLGATFYEEVIDKLITRYVKCLNIGGNFVKIV
ncbi:hypothetical protein J6590_087597 [Homalodisca vitripennis]|nr:hypothetical protein J6590_087597 [Homalodisca vitripennis]